MSTLIFWDDVNVEKWENYGSGGCKIDDWILGEPDIDVY